jgi:hypothetical protein
MVKQIRPGKFALMSQDGKKVLGHHPSRVAAMRQETAINMSKARAAGDKVPPPRKG